MKKTRLKSSKEKDIKNLFSIKKKLCTISDFFGASIRMSEKSLKFNNIRVNKKQFDKSKQAIHLNVVTLGASDTFKQSSDGFK